MTVLRLSGLPVLLAWLLCSVGVVASSSAAWALWLGQQSNSKLALQKSLAVAPWLGLPTAHLWIQLADLEPELEESHLRAALNQDQRNLQALLRLSLIEEFGGNRELAQKRTDRAILYHHNYKSYMAGLSQAARWKDSPRVEALARLALRYCPRDADGVYAQIESLDQAERILAGENQFRKADYFRFLIGQNRLAEALAFQQQLPLKAELQKLRLELCEALFWNHQRTAAARLFARMNPGFDLEGIFNARFRSHPSSLAFDWRLSQNKKTRLSWRPGEMEVSVEETADPVELLSIFLKADKTQRGNVSANWVGETEGLNWQLTEAGGGWRRLVLVAPPGLNRHFKLMELKLE